LIQSKSEIFYDANHVFMSRFICDTIQNILNRFTQLKDFVRYDSDSNDSIHMIRKPVVETEMRLQGTLIAKAMQIEKHREEKNHSLARCFNKV